LKLILRPNLYGLSPYVDQKIAEQGPTTGNSDVPAKKNGNISISETMTDSVEIPTANWRYSTMASSIKLSPSDCDNDGQPEMGGLASPKQVYYHFRLSVVDAIVVGH